MKCDRYSEYLLRVPEQGQYLQITFRRCAHSGKYLFLQCLVVAPPESRSLSLKYPSTVTVQERNDSSA